MEFRSRIYQGRVFHKRFSPKEHEFSYSVFQLLLDLDELPELHKKVKLFSFNASNILAFHEKDYGKGLARGLKETILAQFLDAGLDLSEGRIMVLTNLRCFGYIFNPLTIYYGFDKNGVLRGLLYEVTNTFKDRHSYVIPIEGEVPETVIRQSCDKAMHVSPFMQMKARYDFRMSKPEERVSVRIDQMQGETHMLRASFTGKATALTSRNLRRALFRHPMMTMQVIAAIHWEALHLWRKKIPFFKRPDAPAHGVSIIPNEIKTQ